MSQPRDDLWQRIVNDVRPRARELGAAERSLKQLPAPPTTVSEPYLARVLVRPLRRRRSLLATAASVLLMLGGITSAAFVTTPLIWPTAEQLAELPADYGLGLRAACDETTDPKRRQQALGLLDERCAMLIRDLANHVRAEPRLAAHGARLRAELLAALDHGVGAAEPATEEQFAAALSASRSALRAGTTADTRTRIMDRLRDLALPGLVAVRALTLAGIQVEGGLDPAERLRRALDPSPAVH